MIITSLSSSYQKSIVAPLLKMGFLKHVSPSLLTGLAALFGILVMPFLAMKWIYLAFAALVVSGFLDTLDGALARHANKVSDQGAALDICSDRLVEFCVIFGLYLFGPSTRATGTILMLGSILLCITSFLVVGIFSPKVSEKSFFYSPGLVERAEAFVFFSLMILFPATFWPASVLFSALVFLTAIIRLYQFSYCDK